MMVQAMGKTYTQLFDKGKSRSRLANRVWQLMFDDLEDARKFVPDEYVSLQQFWGVLRWKMAERASVLAHQAEYDLRIEDKQAAARASHSGLKAKDDRHEET